MADAAVIIRLRLPDENPPEGFKLPIVDKPFAELPGGAGDGSFVELDDIIPKGDINANAETARGKLYFLLGEYLTYYDVNYFNIRKDETENTLYKCNALNNNFIEGGDAVIKLIMSSTTTVYCKKQDINAIVLNENSRNNIYGFIPTDVRLGFTMSKRVLINKEPDSVFGQQYNIAFLAYHNNPLVQDYLVALEFYRQQVAAGVEGLEPPERPVDADGNIIEEPEGALVSADHCKDERNDFIQRVCKIRITEEAGGGVGEGGEGGGGLPGGLPGGGAGGDEDAKEGEPGDEAAVAEGGGGGGLPGGGTGDDEDAKEGEPGDEAPEGLLRVIEDQITEIETIVTELYEIITDPDNPAQAAAVQPRKEDAKLQYNAINGFLLPTVIANIQEYIHANPLKNRRRVQDFHERLQRNYFRLSLTIPVPNTIIRAVFGAEAGIIPTPVIPLFQEAEAIGTGGGAAAATVDPDVTLEEIDEQISELDEVKNELFADIVNPENPDEVRPPAELETIRHKINIAYNLISILILPPIIEKIKAIRNKADNREDIQGFQNRLQQIYASLSLDEEVEHHNPLVVAVFPNNTLGIVRPPKIPDFLNLPEVDLPAAMEAELLKLDAVIAMIEEMKRSLFTIIIEPDELATNRHKINLMYNAINQHFLPNVIDRLNAIPVTDVNRDRIQGLQTRLTELYASLKVDGGLNGVVDNVNVAAAFPATMVELIRPPPIPDFVNAIPFDLDIIGERIDQIEEMRVSLTGFISDPDELAAHRDAANGTYNSINKNLLPAVITALQGIEVTANRDRILSFQTRLNALYASLKVDGGLNGVVDNVDVAAAFPEGMVGITRPPPIPVFVVPVDPAAVAVAGGGGDPLVAFAGAGGGGGGGGDDVLVAFEGAGGGGADPLDLGPVIANPLGYLTSIKADILNIMARKNELWAVILLEERRDEALEIYNEINRDLLPAVITRLRIANRYPDKTAAYETILNILLKATQRIIDILNYSLEVYLAFPDDMDGVIRPPELIHNRNIEAALRNAIPDEEDRAAALARIRAAGAGADPLVVGTGGGTGGGAAVRRRGWLDYFARFLRAPPPGAGGGGGGGGILGFLGGLVAVPPPGGGGGGAGGAPAPPPHLPAAAANMLNHVANEAAPIANEAGNGIDPAILARPGLPDPPPADFDLDPADAF